jgi:hypothetical protein
MEKGIVMLGVKVGEGSVFSPREILKEMQEVTAELAKAPEVKARRKEIQTRVGEITKILLKNGIRPDGLTTLAIIEIAERMRLQVENVIALEDLITDVFKGNNVAVSTTVGIRDAEEEEDK